MSEQIREFDPKQDSDGCSGFWTFLYFFITGHCPVYEQACVIHDRAYYYGGEHWERHRADFELRQAVKRAGHPIWAWVMYYGVRVGGHYLIPFPSVKLVDGNWKWNGWNSVRWGYGRPYPAFK